MHLAKTQQIFNVDYKIRDDCYRIVNQHKTDAARIVYYTLENEINIHKDLLIVHSVNDMIVGFIKGKRETLPYNLKRKVGDQKASYIEWFYVDKKFAHQGIGTLLMDRYILHVRQQGVEYLFLGASPTPSALAFYKKYDFKNIGPGFLMGRSL